MSRSEGIALVTAWLHNRLAHASVDPRGAFDQGTWTVDSGGTEFTVTVVEELLRDLPSLSAATREFEELGYLSSWVSCRYLVSRDWIHVGPWATQ